MVGGPNAVLNLRFCALVAGAMELVGDCSLTAWLMKVLLVGVYVDGRRVLITTRSGRTRDAFV
jgi:hypothetical protein